MTPRTALLVTAHGTVSSLDELPAFLQVIRRGHPAPAALVAEVRRRYEAIGGRSPLNEITREQARKCAALLGVPGYVGMRLWSPWARDAVAQAVAEGAERIVSVPAAPFSTGIYHEPIAKALDELGASGRVSLVRAAPYGSHPALIEVFARRIREAAARAGEAALPVVFTAHSLPAAVVARGDRYPALVEQCAAAVAERLGLPAARWSLAYQSQGASEGPWLGPTLVERFDALAAAGATGALLAPIGFLTDHVEVQYDLDIEAVAWGRERGLRVWRAAAPNADDDLCECLASVAREALASAR